MKKRNIIEKVIEMTLFASRWLLAPFYFGLVLCLLLLMLKTGQHLWHFSQHAMEESEAAVLLEVLGLVDWTLAAALVLLVIFSGYENFISKLDEVEYEGWPEWMTKIDFGGLKLKLLSSIVAISAIQLLRAFMDLDHVNDRNLMWLVIIHVVFIFSSLLLAITDRLSAHHKPEPKHEQSAVKDS